MLHPERESRPWLFGADALRDDPLTRYRIAAVTHVSPTWSYLVAFHLGSEARPTDQEKVLLASFLQQYKDVHYRPSTRERMERLPLDVDGTANGVVFHKWAQDDWGYRRRLHEAGHPFSVTPPALRGSPHDDGIPGPLSLPALMDRIHGSGPESDPSPRWREWKATHPEAFVS
ncbi:hypothetical protein [Micromonospora sp. WMMD1082]|uniref:hypothetical protein n=1 Tax=Micromonospora sp. WMMD1082 TaxID=3016104 RepID=UPI002416B33D|nr:hypothetical protein [Micromonospora sp. WMMD1082]MDG4795185.1 hypothetical protein [Micromonospora sp. WMMD1082]